MRSGEFTLYLPVQFETEKRCMLLHLSGQFSFREGTPLHSPPVLLASSPHLFSPVDTNE